MMENRAFMTIPSRRQPGPIPILRVLLACIDCFWDWFCGSELYSQHQNALFSKSQIGLFFLRLQSLLACPIDLYFGLVGELGMKSDFLLVIFALSTSFSPCRLPVDGQTRRLSWSFKTCTSRNHHRIIFFFFFLPTNGFRSQRLVSIIFLSFFLFFFPIYYFLFPLFKQ